MWLWVKWFSDPNQRPLLRKIYNKCRDVRIFRRELRKCSDELARFEKKPREKRDARDNAKEDMLSECYLKNEDTLENARVALKELLEQAKKKERFSKLALFLART